MTTTSPIQQLQKMFDDAELAYRAVDDNYMIIPISEEKGLPLPEGAKVYKSVYLSYNKATSSWAIYIQALLRAIDEKNPRMNKSNMKILLDGARQIYEKEFPTIDKAGVVKIEWETELECDSVALAYDKELDLQWGSVSGLTAFKATPEVMFDILLSLENMPTVEFEEVDAQLNTIQ